MNYWLDILGDSAAQKIEELPWLAGVLVIVTLFVLFASLGLLIIHRMPFHRALKAHHDVTGYVFTNLGVIYAVLLGFTVVNVQQRFDKIKENTQVEASYLGELYRDAAIFPEENRQEIRKAIIEYTKSVIDREWAVMHDGKVNVSRGRHVNQIWEAYYKINPGNSKEMAWYQESIGRLNLLVQARTTRLLGSEESLGSEMWSLLLCGGFVMIGFIWLFSVENIYSHLLMAGLLAASTAFLLFIIYSLDTAYAGQVNIPPEAFMKILSEFQA